MAFDGSLKCQLNGSRVVWVTSAVFHREQRLRQEWWLSAAQWKWTVQPCPLCECLYISCVQCENKNCPSVPVSSPPLEKPSNEVVLVQLEGLASLNPRSHVLRHTAIITSNIILPCWHVILDANFFYVFFQSRAWKCGYFLVCPPITW